MLVASAVIYGALFSLNKIAAQAGVLPIPYAFWQCFIAGIVLWIVSLLMRTPPSRLPSHLLSYLLVGGAGIGVPTGILTHVAPHLPAGLVTMVLVLSPPITYLLGMLVRLERFRWLGVIGILFGFAGVALVAAPSAALPSRDMAGWFLLSLVAPLLFASANICALGWSFVLFGERLGVYIWAALALMFVGLLLTTLREKGLRLSMPGSAKET
jgi:drug/metabolite transporter (DMT)-like permease